ISPTDRFDETLHLVVILFARRGLDSARYVDRKRVQLGNRFRYILRIQSTRNHDRAECVRAISLVPVKNLSGSTGLARRIGIEKKHAAAIIPKVFHPEVRIDAKRREDLYTMDHRTIIRRFVAMKLDGM